MKNVRHVLWWSGIWLTLVMAVAVQAIVPPTSDCDWQRGMDHKMHWPQLPDLTNTAIDLDIRPLMADDFLCGQSGPITDIHIWGGFPVDAIPVDDPGELLVEITLYSDIPATPDSWSHPGESLWSRLFQPGDYNVRMVADGDVGWVMPLNDTYDPCDHWNTYQFNFCIEEEPFVQIEGTVYWLAIEVYDPAGNAVRIGWRNTLPELNWNDAAVVLDSTNNQWLPLVYPTGHLWEEHPLNLAFVITGDPEQKPKFDLGDAPDSTTNTLGTSMTAYSSPLVNANYPTVYGTGSPPHGPLHHDPYGLAYLGPDVTLEQEADVGPDQDLTNNIIPRLDAPDRDRADDSLELPLVLPACQPTRFNYTVTVTNPVQDEAYVNVWFDFNRDGDWEDWLDCEDGVAVPEWAVQNQVIDTSVVGVFTYTTPDFASWHPLSQDDRNPLWMRITLSEVPLDATVLSGGAGPEQGYRYGETEDYLIYPHFDPVEEKLDWGDAPDDANSPNYPTLAVNNGASHVAEGPWFGDRADQPDVDPDGQPHANSMGDDLDTSTTALANDDEDGLGVSVAPLVPGDTGDITVQVNGGGGVVQAWIDFDSDGTWAASEQIYNGFLPNGLHNLTFSVPTTAVSGITHGRFRISRNGGLSPEGPAPDGEVEDHLIPIWEIPPDVKWLQLPDVSHNGIDVKLDSSDGVARSLADDFECTCYGRITNIHLWGSWKFDEKGEIQRIRVRFRPDDPVGAGGHDPYNRYSKPGPEVLWDMTFVPGDFNENLYHQLVKPGEYWWDPLSGELLADGDRQIWEVHIPVEPNEAFLQEGRPDKPIIYWMEVQVQTKGGEFGWKTRRWPDHFMDDAVIGVGSQYKELRYPQLHPYSNEEQDSLDLAFYLTCRPEPYNIPTFLPAAVTQCPPVVTQCPPVPTRCRGVQTRCPAVRTLCPAVATKCPPVQTLCAAKKTKCPALATRCPVVKTQCPPVGTLCPAVVTECPAVATECTFVHTCCPAVETQCPAVETECPPTHTKCNVKDTVCPIVLTRCPPVQTRCPVITTECPASETYCPPLETQCNQVDTYCPALETRCPPMDTQCPVVETRCPPTETQCNGKDTYCPPVETQCPATDTQCPSVDTQCPATDTRCPVVSTKCPPTQTRCPAVLTECPATITECVVLETECPASETKCPVVQTQCPPLQTECPAVATECLVLVTECPAVETRCPPIQTKCPVVETECYAADTYCPPVETQCPATQTTCPPVDTECPAVATRCTAPGTNCDPTGGGDPTTFTVQASTGPPDVACPVVEADCPSVGLAMTTLNVQPSAIVAFNI